MPYKSMKIMWKEADRVLHDAFVLLDQSYCLDRALVAFARVEVDVSGRRRKHLARIRVSDVSKVHLQDHQNDRLIIVSSIEKNGDDFTIISHTCVELAFTCLTDAIDLEIYDQPLRRRDWKRLDQLMELWWPADRRE